MAKAKAPAAAKAPAKAKSGGGGSKFDFKGFLLQHGDRVGLGTACVLALLLFGVMLVPSLFGESATQMAENLEKPTANLQAKLNDPSNLPGDADKPPKDSAEKLQLTLDTSSVDGSKFRIAGLLPPGQPDDRARRQPKVYNVEEAAVALARVQVRTYMFVNQGKVPSVYVLEGGDKDGEGKKGMFPPGMKGGDLGKNLGFGSAGKGGPPPGAGGGPGGLGALLNQHQKKRGKISFSPPEDATSKAASGKRLKAVPLDKVDKNTPLATQVQPVRMAIIAAAFPYKKQVTEFRTRLGARTNDEVLLEAAAVNDAKGNPQFAFRFLGVDVERRELQGDGITPLSTPEGQWKKLDLANDYRELAFATGAEFEPEDKELNPLFFRGLYMKKPPQFRSASEEGEGNKGEGVGMPPPKGVGMPPPKGVGMPPPAGMPPGTGKDNKEEHKPAEDQYPDIEKKLPKIKETLEQLKEKEADLSPPASRFGKTNDLELFGGDEALSQEEAKGTGAKMPMPSYYGAGGKLPNSPSNPEQDTAKEKELPEHCLVRVVDVTVQPGRTYEYRLKVRMANPNYKRKDTASSSYAEIKELTSVDWSPTKLVLRVAPELRYYAVNQAEVEPAGKKDKDGKAMPPFKDAFTRFQSTMTPDRGILFFQAHRWIESLPRGREPLSIGEWVVAERFPVYRGEYVGRRVERVEVPRWSPNQEDFVLTTDGKGTVGVTVNMGYDRPDGKEAILVDFEQGMTGYTKAVGVTKTGKAETKRVIDYGAGEAVLMTPDGRLVVRETATDAADTERTERLHKVRDRLTEIKDRARGESSKDKDKGKGIFP